MPELPEAEYARWTLERHLCGQRVRQVHLVDPTVFRARLSTSSADAVDDPQAVADALIDQVIHPPPYRHGKRLGVRIGEVRFLLHLGMSGRLIRRDTDTPPKGGRLGLRLSGGATWWFEDVRRFGAWVPIEGELALAIAEGLGPDALALDRDRLREVLDGRGAIKNRLMNQELIAGVGNIQATEALWDAGIHPAAPTPDLSPEQWARLSDSVPETLLQTIAETQQHDELVYVSRDPSENPFRVYGRVGQPCPRCQATIEAVKLGGRTSPFCPGCQSRPA